jgi:hypothetical protein
LIITSGRRAFPAIEGAATSSIKTVLLHGITYIVLVKLLGILPDPIFGEALLVDHVGEETLEIGRRPGELYVTDTDTRERRRSVYIPPL